MRLRTALASAALVASTAFLPGTASADPQQIDCPAGSPEGSFCAQFAESDPSPQGAEQIDCPAGAPSGSHCYRFTPPGDPGDGPPGGFGPPSCATESGPLELKSVKANGQEILSELCPFVMYQEQPDPTGGTMREGQISLALEGGDQDVESKIPAGTPVELQLTLGPDPLPHMVMGTVDDPQVAIDGQQVTVKGKAVKVKFSYQFGPEGVDCSNTQELVFVAVGLMGTPSGDGAIVEQLQQYKGAYFFTNAQGFSLPQVSADGTEAEFEVDGCGDDDPNTLEGFAKGFLPTAGVDAMGIDPGALAKLPPDGLPLTFDVEDNGQDVDLANLDLDTTNKDVLARGAAAAQKSTKTPTGILIDYVFSFSRHKITASSDRKSARVANRCARKRKAKLKVKKRGGEQKLVCVKKKRKKKRNRQR